MEETCSITIRGALLGKHGTLWIADIGLALSQDDPALTMSGILLGTPRYMSPEQAEATRRQVDHRSDIYSLGATLYELMTCRPVFEGETPQEILLAILVRDPVAPRRLKPSIPEDLETVVMKAMARRPENRYQSAGALAEDLERWLKSEPIRARRAGPFRNNMLDMKWGVLSGGAVILKDTWDKIAPEYQTKLREAALAAGVEMRAASRKEDEDAIAAMKKQGLVVQQASPQIEEEWRRLANVICPRIRGKMVPPDIFDEVQQLVAEYRKSKAPGK